MLAIKAWRRHTHVPGVVDSFAQLKIITHLRCIENQLLVATGTTLNGAVLTSFLMVCAQGTQNVWSFTAPELKLLLTQVMALNPLDTVPGP